MEAGVDVHGPGSRIDYYYIPEEDYARISCAFMAVNGVYATAGLRS